MKFILISLFDPIPGDETQPIRYFHLTEELIRRGHQVSYITSNFSHLDKKFRKQPDYSLYSFPDLIKIIQIESPSYINNIGFKRIWNHFIFSIRLRNILKKLIRKSKPDKIICAFPPILSSFVSSLIAKKNNIPFILDIQDLWPEVFKQYFPAVLGSIILSPIYFFRNKTIKLASKIVCVSSFYEYIVTQICKEKEIKVFPIGINLVEFDRSKEKNEIKITPDKRIIYLGTSTNNHELKKIIELADSFPQCQFIFAGKGRYSGDMARTNISHKKNITFTGYLSYDKLVELLCSCDVGLLLCNLNNYSFLPSKAFYYMAANLPIVTNLSTGELSSYCIDKKIIFPYDSSDSEQLAQSLKEAIKFSDTNYNYLYKKDKIDIKRIYWNYSGFIEKIIESS